MAPTTIPGRAIASLCCILGILATALPISIISNNFSVEYERYLERKMDFERNEKVKSEKIRRQRAAQSEKGNRVVSVLRSMRGSYIVPREDKKTVQSSEVKVEECNKPIMESYENNSNVLTDTSVKEDRSVCQDTDTAYNPDMTVYPDEIMSLSTAKVNELDIEALKTLFYELRDEYNQLYKKCSKVSVVCRDMEKLMRKLSSESSIESKFTEESY